MSDVKIFTGRNLKSARAKAFKQAEKDVLAGEDAVYFILPNKKSGESDARYMSRLWRINKAAIQSAPEEADWPSKIRDYSHFKDQLEARRDALGANGAQGLRDAARNLVRSELTRGEQIARENTVSGLKKTGAWEQFKKWSRGSGKFSLSKMTYNAQSGQYEYAGKVAFKWDYQKTKKGQPGGMTFTITNLKTGQSLDQGDLAELYTQKKMREAGFSE